MKKLRLVLFKFFWASVITLVTSTAFAANLIEVYQQALRHDPTFQEAYYNYLSNSEIYPQARANLLPLIQGSGQQDANRAHIQNSGKNSFGSHSYILSVNQPIFNYGAWSQLKSAKASVKQAQATFSAALQDLMVRTARSYFAVLEVEDTLEFKLAEKRANARQLEQAKQRYEVGLDPITSVYDAQARYDSVVADEIVTRTLLENRREDLRQITGVYYKNLARLGEQNPPSVRPNPDNVGAWVHAAEEKNYTLLATRYAAQAAKENIQFSISGHLPTLDAVGAVTNTSGGGFSSGDTAPGGNREITNSSIGLQLNVPIYTGGKVNSQVRQARYIYRAAVANLDRAHRAVDAEARKSFNNVVSGISLLKADKQAILSNEAAVNSTAESFKVGTRTFVDVLNAQRDLFSTQSKFARDQYFYISSLLALKQSAGTLSVSDLFTINRWLTRKHQDL